MCVHEFINHSLNNSISINIYHAFKVIFSNFIYIQVKPTTCKMIYLHIGQIGPYPFNDKKLKSFFLEAHLLVKQCCLIVSLTQMCYVLNVIGFICHCQKQLYCNMSYIKAECATECAMLTGHRIKYNDILYITGFTVAIMLDEHVIIYDQMCFSKFLLIFVFKVATICLVELGGPLLLYIAM